MFFCLKYLVFIVTFNHCCGSSHLIPTAVFTRSVFPAQNRQRISAGPVSRTGANYYAIGPNLPFGPNPSFGELQYSASHPEPNLQIPKDNIKNVAQKKRYIQKPVSVQRVRAQVEAVKIPNVNYMPTRINQRPNLSSKVRSVQTQVDPMLTTNQKSMVLKAQISGTTFTPMPSNSFQMTTITKPLIFRRHKFRSEFNSTFPRVQSISFNWPKPEQQILQNYSQNQQTIHREVSASEPEIQPQSKHVLQPQLQTQPQQWTSSPSNENSKRQKYDESRQNFRFSDSTDKTEEKYSPTFETEIFRETTPLTITEPTTVATKEEAIDSDKKENLSSLDSGIHYEAQYYNSEKPFNQDYDQNEQINNDGTPINDNNELSLPESATNYVNSEPEPEIHTDNIEDNNKELTDGSVESSSGLEFKSLLKHFIQQLDLLKFVASKELYKANDYSQNYRPKSDDQLIQQTVTEPLVSKSVSNYNDYQNERSIEQISNSESKDYRDTHENTGRKPCEKPFHLGALPNLEAY